MSQNLTICTYHTILSNKDTKFPEFINSVIFIKTTLLLPDLFIQIKLIEKSLGRTLMKQVQSLLDSNPDNYKEFLTSISESIGLGNQLEII